MSFPAQDIFITSVLVQHTTMVDHPDTWARIVEMVLARYPGDEPVAQAFERATYDAEETAAYAAAQDTDEED
jgi:hypothetical protein